MMELSVSSKEHLGVIPSAFYEENGEVQIDIECEFLPNNYNQYEGTLTTVDWEYLTDEDRENDIRTPYTCTATVVGIRKK